jgi:type II secretion system protein H
MKTITKSVFTSQQRCAGFTLVELAIIFLVIGLIAAVAVPSFRQFTERSRVDGTAQELIMDIQYARSLAVSRNQTYQIQFQANSYQIIETNTGTVMRTKNVPNRVALVTTGNPRFRSWGRADPVNITVTGTHNTRMMAVLVTGNVRRL